MSNIEQPIKDYIAREFLFDSPEKIVGNDDLLIQDGIIDSLGIFLMISFIEQEFGIKVQPAEVVLENFESVTAIRNLVMSKMAAKPASV